MSVGPSLVVAGGLAGAGGGLATAAAVAVALAGEGRRDEGDRHHGGVLLVELGAPRRRTPTLLASEAARGLEARLRPLGLEAAARGRLAWLTLDAGSVDDGRLAGAVEAAGEARAVVVHAPPTLWRPAFERRSPQPSAALLRADLPAQRALAALVARDLVAAGRRVRIATRAPGRIATRRALSGVDPGGETAGRAARLARGLTSQRGQAMPLAVGSILALIACALVLAAFGGAVTGTARVQRAADLAALSAARSMRDDFDRLFVAARLGDGSPNPLHLSRSQYLSRAAGAAREAARRNGADPERLRIAFPDAESFAPLRARASIEGGWRLAGLSRLAVDAVAEAEAVPPAGGGASLGQPATASGGGYSGPLAYRQGEGMRPDVAAAFDRLTGAARAAGLAVVVNSGFRSDAEQAALFERNPDPRWVAPPGTSLHRCATELDLGPPAAYGWLAANAERFGFLRRYAWEPWHYGYVRGPDPCSAEAEQPGEGADGAAGRVALPAYVPARFRRSLIGAASRWNVSATLLAAQLLAESNFNPFAVSPAGARGIAQFMPGTAAAYGLSDPFDAAASIDAQAHLMSDHLRQFGSVPLALAAYNAGPGAVAACDCVPAYPETQAYVARILGLLGGGGALPAPIVLEVRLVD